MTANVGSADRIARIILGLILVLLPFFSGWGSLGTIISVLIGGVLVVTALMRFCPLYRLIGANTCKV